MSNLSAFIRGHELKLADHELVRYVREGALVPFDGTGKVICLFMSDWYSALVTWRDGPWRHPEIEKQHRRFEKQFKEELLKEKTIEAQRRAFDEVLKHSGIMERPSQESSEAQPPTTCIPGDPMLTDIMGVVQNNLSSEITLIGNPEIDRKLMNCLLGAFYLKTDVEKLRKASRTSQTEEAKSSGKADYRTEQWEKAIPIARLLIEKEPQITLEEIRKDPSFSACFRNGLPGDKAIRIKFSKNGIQLASGRRSIKE